LEFFDTASPDGHRNWLHTRNLTENIQVALPDAPGSQDRDREVVVRLTHS
jgi:hypothetical protein